MQIMMICIGFKYLAEISLTQNQLLFHPSHFVRVRMDKNYLIIPNTLQINSLTLSTDDLVGVIQSLCYQT